MNVIRPAARLSQTSMRRAGQEDIAAALGGEILSGARKPGERMPTDADMLKTFGVSRVVTREVIKTLAAKGLVTFAFFGTEAFLPLSLTVVRGESIAMKSRSTSLILTSPVRSASVRS